MVEKKPLSAFCQEAEGRVKSMIGEPSHRGMLVRQGSRQFNLYGPSLPAPELLRKPATRVPLATTLLVGPPKIPPPESRK